MDPYVSVILPTYNRGATLTRAIHSVLAQHFEDLELLVVDDASTDATTDVVNSIQDDRLRYIKRPRRGGAGAARNTGLGLARGRLIAFQDSDDEWLPRKLDRQVHLLGECDAKVGLVYCASVLWDGACAQLIPSSIRPSRLDGDIRSSIASKNLCPTPAWLVRRDCFDRVGAFDEDLQALEDWEWIMRMSTKYSVRFIDETLLISHQSTDSLSRDAGRLAQGVTEIIKKHRERLRREAPTGLVSLYIRAGFRESLANGIEAGRRTVWEGIRTFPASLRLWAMWILTFSGRKLMQRVRGLTGWRLSQASWR